MREALAFLEMLQQFVIIPFNVELKNINTASPSYNTQQIKYNTFLASTVIKTKFPQ